MFQVAKAIKLQKAKTVIVTPNIEQIETEGGLDDLLASILVQAERSSCPVVFALSRKKLGQVSLRLVDIQGHGECNLGEFNVYRAWKLLQLR